MTACLASAGLTRDSLAANDKLVANVGMLSNRCLCYALPLNKMDCEWRNVALAYGCDQPANGLLQK